MTRYKYNILINQYSDLTIYRHKLTEGFRSTTDKREHIPNHGLNGLIMRYAFREFGGSSILLDFIYEEIL